MKLEFSKFLEFYEEHQDKDNKFFYEHYPKSNKDIIRSYKSRAKKRLVSSKVSPKVSKKKIRSSQPKSPNIAKTLESIENPVAYTTSHIFKKMIETGDYRWAQLFVQVLEKTNKLDYETIREQEWLNQASNMSMRDLVEKVAKRESISRSTLRRLDELEDTSPYESL